MRRTDSIAFAVWMGLIAPFGFFVADSLGGIVSFAVCQCFAVRRNGWRSSWPVFLTMIAPLLAFFLFMLAMEKRKVVLGQGIPILLGGCIGNAAGALIGSAIGRVCLSKAARKKASAGMAFFVVGDQMGIHVYEYDDTSKFQLRPGEVLVGRADTLEEAQLNPVRNRSTFSTSAYWGLRPSIHAFSWASRSLSVRCGGLNRSATPQPRFPDFLGQRIEIRPSAPMAKMLRPMGSAFIQLTAGSCSRCGYLLPSNRSEMRCRPDVTKRS